MACMWHVVDEAYGETDGRGLRKLLDIWAQDLQGASLAAQMRHAQTILHVACVAEGQMILTELSADPIEWLKSQEKAKVIEVVRQFLAEGFFTLNEIDPPPDRAYFDPSCP